MLGLRRKPKVPRLSEYLVKVGVPADVVERAVHEHYDQRLGELGVERGYWTRQQFAEAMRLQALDRGDVAAASRWAVIALTAARVDANRRTTEIRARLSVAGGKP